jgi:hypothetical protein
VKAAILARCGSLPIRERIGVPLVILVLLFFIGIGIDTIIHPRRHMNFYLRSGGEMLRAWNEAGVQVAGLVFSCASGWMLFELVRSVWTECFG